MHLYKVRFIEPSGGRSWDDEKVFKDDDEAIDTAGECGYPHEIVLAQGERIVARFPPLGQVQDWMGENG